MNPLYRVTYCVAPKIGGTFAYFVKLRRALRPLGGEVFAVTAGAAEAALWDRRYADDGCICLAPEAEDPKAAAQALDAWIERQAVNILIPISSAIAASAAPHLPRNVKVVARCSSITRHAYHIVTCNLPYTARIVTVSKRQYDDLLYGRRVPPDRLTLIPTGVELPPDGTLCAGECVTDGRIRVGYVGRLEHMDKKCLHLVRLVEHLERRGVPYALEIAGDGPDREKLRRHLDRVVRRGVVRFHGAVPSEWLSGVYRNIDVLVFPSHFEGLGISLLEAMAHCCVPIAFRVSGVTDWVIEHAVSGFVCPMGRTRSMAAYIEALARDPVLRGRMGAAARARIATRFTADQMARDLHRLFLEVIQSAEPTRPEPKPWDDFQLEPAYRATWRRFVPLRLKIIARRLGLVQ